MQPARRRAPTGFLAELGARLVADGLPLAGGALTLAVPHPLIARRTWLWRAESGEVIEALGSRPGGLAAARNGKPGRRCRPALARRARAPAPVHEDVVGPRPDGPSLGWIGPRPFTPDETDALRQAARFAAAPLAALAARATLAAALEAYLGRRSAARVLAGPLRRDIGETIQAALLYADLRGFTALSESNPPAAVIAALDAWFDRIAGAVHAFGGEVLKFIGDGVLAIFPVVGAVAARRLRRGAARGRPRRGPAWRISTRRDGGRGCRLCPSAPRCISARCCGAISAPPIGWISPRSAPPSTWSAGWKGCAGRSTRPSSSRAHSPPRPPHADPARDACAARHRISLRGLHCAGGLMRPLSARWI